MGSSEKLLAACLNVSKHFREKKQERYEKYPKNETSMHMWEEKKKMKTNKGSIKAKGQTITPGASS